MGGNKITNTTVNKPCGDFFVRIIFSLNVKKYVYFHRKEFRRIAAYIFCCPI